MPTGQRSPGCSEEVSLPERARSVSEGQRSLARRFIQDASWVANMRRGAGPSPRANPEVFLSRPASFPTISADRGERKPLCPKTTRPVAHAHRGVKVAVPTPALWATGEENPSGIPIPRPRVNKTEKYATGLYTNPHLPDRLVTTATYMKPPGSSFILNGATPFPEWAESSFHHQRKERGR